jgi:hypothetical protein
MTKLAVEVTGDDRSAAMFLKLQSRVKELETNLRGMGAAAQQSGNDLNTGLEKGIGQLKTMATSYISVQAGIQAASQALTIFLQNMEQAANAGDKFAASVRGFAFEGGSPDQIDKALRLGAQFSLTKPEMAVDLVDTMADMMGGNIKAAFAELPGVLALTQAGIPETDLKDIATAALSRGRSPSQFGRDVTGIGAETGIAPGKLVGFMREAELFPTIGEGLATTAMLMQRLGERKTHAGLLSIVDVLGEGAPPEFKKFLKRTAQLGKGATSEDRLNALASLRVDTPEELQKAGLALPQAHALSIAVQRRSEIMRLAALRYGAGEFAERVAAAEEANPELLNERVNASLRAEQRVAEMRGPLAVEGQLVEQEGLRVGIGFRKRGVEQIGPFDTVNEQGGATLTGRLLQYLSGQVAVVEKQLKAADAMIEASKNLNKGATELRGGAALVPGTEDK